MGTTESCCKKDSLAPVGDFKEIIHASPYLKDVEDQDAKDTAEIHDLVAVGVSLSEETIVCSEPDVSIDPALLRGISLTSSLRSFGRVWKTAPSKLKANDHEFLLRSTTQVDGYDVFLSHTWKTSGRLKLWTLLLRSGWPCTMISWCLCTVVTSVLYVLKVLPNFWWYQADSYNFSGWVPHSAWIRITLLLAFSLGLAVTPYRCASEMAFIDVASINQKEPHLTKLGVYGLAGFLSKTAELRVLWSPQLFSRLWCIFELAAFHKVNPKGRVVLAPLYVETIIGMLLIGLMVLKVTYFLITTFLPGFAMAAGVLNLLPAWPLVHYVRKTLREKQRLLTELQHFDVNEAQCSSEFDRNFILTQISHWYGSHEAFNLHVRSELFQELSSGELSGIQVPLPYWVLLGMVEASSLLEFHVSFVRARAPWDALLAQILASVVSATLWRVVLLRLTLSLTDYVSPRSRWCLVDLLKTTAVFLLMCGFAFAAQVVCSLAQSQGVLTSAFSAAVAIFSTVLALCGLPRSGCCLAK